MFRHSLPCSSSEDRYYAENYSLPLTDESHYVAPLFDETAVETNPPSPLAGMGFYQKHFQNHIKLISPQLHSLPYRNYLMELGRNYRPDRIMEDWYI